MSFIALHIISLITFVCMCRYARACHMDKGVVARDRAISSLNCIYDLNVCGYAANCRTIDVLANTSISDR